MKPSTTKRGDPMLYFTLEEIGGSVECLAFKQELKLYQPIINLDAVVFVKGEVGYQSTSPTIRVKEIVAVKDALTRLTKCVTIRIDTGFNEEKMTQLKDIIRKHSGTCPLFFEISTPGHGNTYVKSSSQYFPAVSDDFLSKAKALFGPDTVEINQAEVLAMV